MRSKAKPPISGPTPGEEAPSQHHLPAGSPALAPTATLLRAEKLQLMLGQVGARGMSQAASLAGLFSSNFDALQWQELRALQQAVLLRLQKQQQSWLWGLAALGQEYGQLKQANTLSKYVEQECNLAAQFNALLTDQATQLAGLLENIQVDCGYWISEVAERHRAARLG